MSTFIPTHQRAKVRQRSSLVCSNLRVFHVATRSFLASFSLFSCMASFLSTTSIASLTCFWHPQQGSRIDIGERGDWRFQSREDRQNSVALETAEHHQPLLNDLLAVSLVTGKRKMLKKAQCWENMKKGQAVASLARLSMKASANSDVSRHR